MTGLLLSLVLAMAVGAAKAWLSREECGGEYRPVLGSGRQAFAIRGCLARDAGPLIGLKKSLGIYDPRWQTVIK